MSSKTRAPSDTKTNRKNLPSSTSRSRSTKDDDAWLDAELAKLASTTTTPLTSKKPTTSRSKRDPSDREPSQPPPPSAAPPRSKPREENPKIKTAPTKEVRAHRSSSARPPSSSSRTRQLKKNYNTDEQTEDIDGLSYAGQDVVAPSTSVLPDSIDIPGVSVSLEELVVEEEAATAREKAKTIIQQEEPALDVPDEYEEDFEEYEEDFEEFDEEEEENVKAQEKEVQNIVPSDTYNVVEKRSKEAENELDDIKKAMKDENETTQRQRTESANARDRKLKEEKLDKVERRLDPEHEAFRAPLPERNRVDIEQLSKKKQFAKRKLVMNSKTERRVKDLAGLIDLDVASYNLLDLPPMSEYELYIRNFGTSNTQQTYTQSNEDQVDGEAQTDDWMVEDKWSQMPSDGLMECGSGVPGIESSQKDPSSNISEQIKEMKNVIKKHNRQGGGKEDSVRLAKFLRNASQTCEILLDENLTNGGSSHWFSMASSLSFSQGCRTLTWDHIIQEGRHVTSICFSPNDSRQMLTVWSLPGNNRVAGVWGHAARAWDHMGVVCLWRNDCSRPSRLLVCEGEITCCKFNPTKSHIIYGGTADGGVVVWDLREITVTTGTNYSIIQDKDDQSVYVQKPAYNTQALYIQKEGHTAPIQKLLPLPPKLNRSSNKSADGVTLDMVTSSSTGAAPSQLATVDSSGVLHTWVLIELAEADLAGCEVDVGLAIGSVVKLIKSASMYFKNSKRGGTTPDVTVLDCVTQPDDPSRFFAAVDIGCVLRASRFGDKTVPSAYYINSHSTPSASAGVPTTLNISHMADPTESTPTSSSTNYLLLTGYDTGAFTIHSIDDPVPILSFSAMSSPPDRPSSSTAPVTWARFSPHRPAVFYVLDAQDNLMIWDLLESDSAPLHVSSLSSSAPNDSGKITAIGLFGDLEDAAAYDGVLPHSANSANAKNGYIAFAHSTGNVHVHLLSEELCEPAIDEKMQFRDMMESRVK